jgi:hypothetical protein
MEDDMANITYDRDWTGSGTAKAGFVERAIRRLRVLVRARSIARVARSRRGLVRDEQASDRLLADVGIDAREYRRYDWLGQLSSALGGPMR